MKTTERSPIDSTIRNVRAVNKKIEKLTERVKKLEEIVKKLLRA